jgi:hypothetical protein
MSERYKNLGNLFFFVVKQKKYSIQLLIHEFVGVSKQSLDLPKETFLTKKLNHQFFTESLRKPGSGEKERVP